MVVRWEGSAPDRLADFYVALSVDGQQKLAWEIEQINAQLVPDPSSLGESRDGIGRRIWCEGPLAVLFRLVPGCGVVVLYVSWLPRGAVEDDDL